VVQSPGNNTRKQVFGQEMKIQSWAQLCIKNIDI